MSTISLEERAWVELIKSSEHKEKIKEAMLINPAAVERLLREEHRAEQTHNKRMLNMYKSFSTDFRQFRESIKMEHQMDSLLHDMLELEMTEDVDTYEMLNEVRKQRSSASNGSTGNKQTTKAICYRHGNYSINTS
ncbi:uncharacterized protein [Watersipora subatra]|uniref:uncharacterized protein isoform X2 n=1 Tax=Watersipora subatra TaxID=2589382 RepID=UPI00355C451B